MNNITLVVLAAGNSTRFNSNTKKQWIRIEDEPLWLYVTNTLSQMYHFSKIIIVGNSIELNYMANFTEDNHILVSGGKERQDSMRNALEYVDSEYVMITDVARSCVPKHIVDDILAKKGEADCIVPYLSVNDTVVFNNNTIDRDEVKLIQTPQLSVTNTIKKALIQNIDFTDDSSAIKNIGGSVIYVKGSKDLAKITFGEELEFLPCLKSPSNKYFTGGGFDIHPFENNKEMFLGGVKIDVDYGFKAHSDGDVLIHSVIDALLGGCGAGDIGEFFPDNDDKYKNIDSKVLLKEIVNFINSVGYEIVNVDLTIIAQQPRINRYKQAIKNSLSELIGIKKQFINIKATTAEKLGFIGRKEGVAVLSNTTLRYFNWR